MAKVRFPRRRLTGDKIKEVTGDVVSMGQTWETAIKLVFLMNEMGSLLTVLNRGVTLSDVHFEKITLATGLKIHRTRAQHKLGEPIKNLIQ